MAYYLFTYYLFIYYDRFGLQPQKISVCYCILFGIELVGVYSFAFDMETVHFHPALHDVDVVYRMSNFWAGTYVKNSLGTCICIRVSCIMMIFFFFFYSID